MSTAKIEDMIRLAHSRDFEAIRELWREYWEWLALPPEFQGFAEECRTLPGAYAEPSGRLLLAVEDENVAGTAALRPLSDSACEAKRLYVRPKFRGLGLGRALLYRLIEEAQTIGYHELFADTLPSMHEALRLYRRAGFKETGPYAATPTPRAIYLRLSLRESPQRGRARRKRSFPNAQ